MKRAIFLDRDGVLNRSEMRNGKPFAPQRLSDFRLLPGAADAVARLKQRGFLILVVTNQPDIENGKVPTSVVEAMHDRLMSRTAVDDVLMCPHSQSAGCRCRKPKSGLVRLAARRWDIDLLASYMVGDRSSDMVAGNRVGCYTIFVDRRYADGPRAVSDAQVGSLRQAVEIIVQRERVIREP